MTSQHRLLERIRNAETEVEPFLHLCIHEAFDEEDFLAFKRALPSPEGFDLKGRGLKLELDIVESGDAFKALPASSQEPLIRLRELFRQTVAPALVERFREVIEEKYRWLFGEEVARDILAAGLTTTNGRVMGRAPGYRLEPHLDSAHTAVTCLLYFSSIDDVDDGALCLFVPDRRPEVLTASTYYPEKAEGIASTLAKTIPIQENLLVAFVNGPTSLHGLRRSKTKPSLEWRLAYQCHLVPTGFALDSIASRLSPERRARWDDILARKHAYGETQ
jgi:hypothetical protein